MVVPIVVAAAARVGATTAARTVATQGAKAAATQGARAVGSEAVAGTEARVAQGSRQAQFQNTNIGDMGGRRAPIERPRTDIRDGSPRQSQLSETQSPESAAQQAEKRRIDGVKQQQVQRTQQQQAEEEEQTPTEPPYVAKIDSADLIPMLIVAIIFDALQIAFGLLIIGVVTAAISYIAGFFLGIMAFIIFGIWFGTKGISIFAGRKLVMSGVGFLADTAFAGILPVWVITVLFVYFDEKGKERGIDVIGTASKIIK